jgi:hypothetical protein
MGGVASSLTKPYKLTGKEFRDSETTQQLNKMSNALFEFMYGKYKLKDIFDIAENPGEYVIAISDLISAEFNTIGYTTGNNKYGEIYFRKWSELDPPKTQEEYQKIMSGTNSTRKKRIEVSIRNSESSRKSSDQVKHEKNAKIIAFYFVRIFQILGAMLLVVKDTKFPDINIIRGPQQSNAARVYARQAKSVIPGFRPLAQGGGGISDFPRSETLGPFDFLRKYLKKYDEEYRKEVKEEYNVDIPLNTEGYYKFNYSDNLFFKFTKPNPIPNVIGGAKTPGSKQEFCMLVKDKNSTVVPIRIDVNIVEFDCITGSFLNEWKAPSEFEQNIQLDRYPTSVVISTKHNNTDFYAQFKPRGRNNINVPYPNGIDYILTEYRAKPNNDLFIALNNEFDLNKQFVRVLEEYVIKTINRSNTSAGQGYSRFTAQAIESSLKDNIKKGGPEGPKTHKGLMATFTELSSEKHLPHCISRAIQLLDIASISDENREERAGTTRICSSIKGRGTSYQPLKSIGQLFGKLKVKSLIVDGEEFKNAEQILRAFVGKESVSMPLTVKQLTEYGQQDESLDMTQGIRRLVEAFNMNNKLVSEIQSFDDINLDPPAACSRTGVTPEVLKGRPEFIEMQKHAQRLLATHLNNVIGITEFLKTIFNISQRPDGSWKVDGPDTGLLFAGYHTLDKITKQARELLVNYYSECEVIYQEGVKTWVGSLPESPAGPGQRVLLNPSAPTTVVRSPQGTV